MLMFRGMGLTHIAAGLFLTVAYAMGCDMGSGDTQAIILSQVFGGALMAITGFIFKI